jgi:ribosomal protein S18 acetylase RimI-like enzyme
MIISQATLDDIDSLAILNKFLIEDEKHPNPMNIEQLAQRMSGWLQGEYQSYLVKVEGRIAAYCLYRDDGQYYYLRQLYVDRNFRRQGIATQLLDWMYANIWADKKVRLDVLIHNHNAILFYEKYGFKIEVLRMEK